MVFSYLLREIIQFLHTCHIQSTNSRYCQWTGSLKKPSWYVAALIYIYEIKN
jgi:hypothetical protein